MASLWFVCLMVTSLLKVSIGATTLELGLVEYRQNTERDTNEDSASKQCDYSFNFCGDYSSSDLVVGSSCELFKAQWTVFGAQDVINLENGISGNVGTNPIKLTGLAPKRKVKFNVAVWNTAGDSPIDQFLQTIPIHTTYSAQPQWIKLTIHNKTTKSQLDIKIRLYREDNGSTHDDSVDGHQIDYDIGGHDSNKADSCQSVKCENDGTCHAVNSTTYVCTCKVPYHGTNCEFHLCELGSGATVCHGDGFCTPDGCSCRDLCIGEYCESCPCDGIDCLNGACDPYSGGGKCTCSDGYTGEHCELYICDWKICLNEGWCDGGTGSCVCVKGHFGEQCQYHLCDWLPCQNGATCHRETGGCTCSQGYIGDRCEVHACDVDELKCQNGGTCDRITGGCKCTEGYGGFRCISLLCDVYKCENNGTCIYETGKCVCPEGFSGETCETGPCDVIDCEHGGKCLHGICICHDDYEGVTCAHKKLIPGALAGGIIFAAALFLGLIIGLPFAVKKSEAKRLVMEAKATSIPYATLKPNVTKSDPYATSDPETMTTDHLVNDDTLTSSQAGLEPNCPADDNISNVYNTIF